MAGLYFEEFNVDQVFRHALTRTVTEMDNTLFCALTHNPQPCISTRSSRRSPSSASDWSTASSRSG